MAKQSLLHYPFVEAHVQGAGKRPTTIELSLSQTTSDKGAALAIALSQHNAPVSFFDYTVDDEQAFSCMREPSRTIKVLICAEPHEREPLWEEGVAKRVMYRTAQLVAELCWVYGIPPQYVVKESRWRRRGGILLSVVGEWPSQSFISDVRSDIRELRKGPNA